MAWRKPFRHDSIVSSNGVDTNTDHVLTADGQYLGEKGGNDAPPTYQDASGAPVERHSPLGYSVGPVTITMLNISMMIGAGIYSTRERFPSDYLESD